MTSRAERFKNIEQIQKKEEKKERKEEKRNQKKERKLAKKIQKEEQRQKERNQEIKKKSKLKYFICGIFILCILVLSYAYFIEPHLLLIHDHIVYSNEISENTNGLKIVHFSDLHYGTSIKEKDLEKLIKKINNANPDILVFTGDLIDQSYSLTKEETSRISNLLKKLKATYGKYTILGNHDSNTPLLMNLFYDSDFKFLKNSYDLIYIENELPIALYGTDFQIDFNSKIAIKEKTSYTIILTHIPDQIDTIVEQINPNLILSGHSHNGQIKIPYLNPFWLPEGSQKYYAPHYQKNNTEIFVSNGIGTSILPLRFGSIPSFNVYRLLKQK